MKVAVNLNTEDYTRNSIYINIILAKADISKLVYVRNQPPLSWLKQIIPPKHTLYQNVRNNYNKNDHFQKIPLLQTIALFLKIHCLI